jgi:NAD(P)-dependent dehydrogenase (short-subunit alcohol dehydrogenase family)
VTKLCEGRVAVITGAGRGIGREHALMLAAHGAKVVVNDLGASPEGTGADAGPANEVVEAIRAMGGEAVVNGSDISDMAGAKALIDQAIDTFGGLDIVINNAGILRDRMIFSLSEEDWDSIIKVHLKGTFATTHYASKYWRERVKAGHTVDARVINTSSPSGIYGNVGQTNYGAAKAGIAAFTVIAAQELVRYGVTVNCIAPAALTRLTAGLSGAAAENPELAEALSPRWIAVIATWLASPEAKNVTGRVFDVRGKALAVAETWVKGPVGTQTDDPADLGPVVADLMARARLNSDMNGDPAEGPGRPARAI